MSEQLREAALLLLAASGGLTSHVAGDHGLGVRHTHTRALVGIAEATPHRVARGEQARNNLMVGIQHLELVVGCLLYTSDAADD